MQSVRHWVESLGDQIDRVVCTHKDLVKLRTDRIAGRPLAALIIDLALQSNADTLDQVLSGIAAAACQKASSEAPNA